MGRIRNMNEMVKATLTEESMASAGKSPLQVVDKEMGRKNFSEEEKKKIHAIMKEMDMDEESDMEQFEKACKEAKDYSEMKKAIEKYMK